MTSKVTLGIIGLLVMLAILSGRPQSLPYEASGSISQTLCGKTFVARLDPDDVFQEHQLPEPGMWLIAWAITYHVNRIEKLVSTDILGFFSRRSAFTTGRGCTLAYEGHSAPVPLSEREHTPALLPSIAERDEPVTGSADLAQAMLTAFTPPASDRTALTKAIVIVHNGRVIAERYTAGYSPSNALLSHSIAKSVVNALIGILVRDGKLTLTDKAPVEAWRSPNDPRAAITIDNLLRMNAGFGFDEGGGASPATHMWFSEFDTAHFAAEAQLESPIGRDWGYSSRSYAILSRIIADKVSGGPQGVKDFAQRELFDPLGMHSVTLEFDAYGTMMGANAMFATPRDWAKFGLLYLNKGKIGETQILPLGWVAYSARPTGRTGYGAGFWLNNTHTTIAHWGLRWGIPGAPADAFFSRGYLGQFVVVVPSQNLVIVRFGISRNPGSEAATIGRLVKDTISALKQSAPN